MQVCRVVMQRSCKRGENTWGCKTRVHTSAIAEIYLQTLWQKSWKTGNELRNTCLGENQFFVADENKWPWVQKQIEKSDTEESTKFTQVCVQEMETLYPKSNSCKHVENMEMHKLLLFVCFFVKTGASVQTCLHRITWHYRPAEDTLVKKCSVARGGSWERLEVTACHRVPLLPPQIAQHTSRQE